MERLKNPFAVRDGKIVMIKDMAEEERGLLCRCRCPSCDGDFIARIGKIKVHHFAHSKDACDEMLTYTTGMYRLIHQILSTGCRFYVPALMVAYHIPDNKILDEKNVESYVNIVRGNHLPRKAGLVCKGKYVSFGNVEFSYNKKGHIQALELTYKDKQLAIKVTPPYTICKFSSVSPHKGMATLEIDFMRDADLIQTSNSEAFREYLLSDRLHKHWISNPQVKRAYPIVIKRSNEAYQKQLEIQKCIDEANEAERLRRMVAWEEQRVDHKEKPATEIALADQKKRDEWENGYEQVKDLFVQQGIPIVDSYGNRWVQCEICGKVKREEEFTVLGGTGSMNAGKCKLCMVQGG